MTYAETLDYIFHKLPMFTRVGAAAYKKDLTNTVALCSYLGNPQTKFKSIHVGGTNGKGSTSHMLASILQSAGYKTGLYTSPHLYDFRERIKVNGKLIPEENVISFIEKIQPLIESLEPSFFEITVAMAFEYFSEQKIDIAVVEVGLGGRLDSTNVIDPLLSVITNISLDHTALLGNTVEEIAGEKAGIIKRGKPVVIGERSALTDDVFINKAKETVAPITFATDNYKTLDQEWTEGGLSILVKNKKNNKAQNYLLDLPGIYQTKNICTVLTAIDQLREQGFKISDAAIENGLSSVKQSTGLFGRWEQLAKAPAIYIDVAHNEAGIKELMLQLKGIEYKKLHIVIGMVKDKAIDKVLALLPHNAAYYFTQSDIPRALPCIDLQDQAGSNNLYGEAYKDVNFAIESAINQADKEDVILVCGSIFLIAEIDRKKIQ